MAITPSVLRFLLSQRDDFRLGTDGGRILVLGVQDCHMTHAEAKETLRRAGVEPRTIPPTERRYTDSKVVPRTRQCLHVVDLFRMFGFDDVHTLDFSPAEGPTHVHNLNQPAPPHLVGAYDVLFDNGCLEHVCDVRQSLETTVRILRPGGRIALILPLFGWHNQVYFNFQPPFLHEVYAANGFQAIREFINYYPEFDEWVDRPLEYRELQYGDEIRFTRPFHRTNICFFACKGEADAPFVTPNQGWYVEYHRDDAVSIAEGRNVDATQDARHPGLLKRWARRWLPYWVKVRIWSAIENRRLRRLSRIRPRCRLFV